MKLFVAILASLLLLAVAAFCVFGFLATFEPTDNALVFRVGYTVIGIGSIAGVILLFVSLMFPRNALKREPRIPVKLTSQSIQKMEILKLPIAELQARIADELSEMNESTRTRSKKHCDSMNVLFLHGWHSVPGGVKPTYLKDAGHEVLNPALDDDDFDLAVRTAQAEYDENRPDVIMGSSRGGAVAMNIDSGDTPLVLLCPAWKNWGTAMTLKPNSVILHSRQDDVIPFADSVELVTQSGLSPDTLIEVGSDHRLADPEPRKAMLDACERLTRKPL